MVNSLYFLIFYLVLYLLGRGILIATKPIFNIQEISNIKVSNFPISIIYPLFGLFFIGQIVLITNFFKGSDNLFVYVFGALPLIANFFDIHYGFRLKDFNNLFIKITTLIIIGFSSNTINFHQDAATYHLNNQLYIRTEKVVLGLANIHARYGFSSLSEYINSFFWNGSNFIFLHFVNLVFIGIFYFFIIWCLLESDILRLQIAAIAILLFGILDNFGIEGGRNGYIDIEAIGKPDTAFAILFFLSNYIIIEKIYSKKILSDSEFSITLFLILFSAEYRFFGLISLVGLLYLIKNDIKKYVTLNILPFFSFGLIWVFKNFLITSCLIYPITFTCIPSPWGNTFISRYQSFDLRSYHRAYKIFEETPLDWYFRWNERYLNYYVGINLAISIVLVLLFLTICFKSDNKDTPKNRFVSAYLFLIWLLWLVSAPSIRFGIGIFILSILVLSFRFNQFRFQSLIKIINSRLLKITILTLTILATPLVQNYEPQNYTSGLKKIQVREVSYEDHEITWGQQVKVKESDRELGFCWLNKECTPPPNFIVTEESLISYRMMILEDSSVLRRIRSSWNY